MIPFSSKTPLAATYVTYNATFSNSSSKPSCYLLNTGSLVGLHGEISPPTILREVRTEVLARVARAARALPHKPVEVDVEHLPSDNQCRSRGL